MPSLPIYFDNHATTRVDPRVVEAMLPYFSEVYGNPASTTHSFGWDARDAVGSARERIATAIGATPREIVFTSGATESNNLAIRGVAERARRQGNHFVSVATEHKAVLDPLDRLSRRGFEVTLLPVAPATQENAGAINLNELQAALRPETLLVSVMLANNEIGVIHPLKEVSNICRERGVLLHCDATQAIGKLPLDVADLGVDLLSFSAHKLYGPKGIGALYVRRSGGAVKLDALIAGGGHEGGLRSGTLNVPSIVGFATALELCLAELPQEMQRLTALRDRLWAGLSQRITGVSLNGPSLSRPSERLPGNLNCRFDFVDGEALVLNLKEIAVSSGSACTSANPEPSHVLRALALSDDAVRSSLRFGLGRFNAEEEIDYAIEHVAETVKRLRALSSVAQ